MMNSKGKSVLILLGGMWHDFDGFASLIQLVFESKGFRVESTYDLDILRHLDQAGCDLLLSYTCLSEHRHGYDDSGPDKLTNDQVSGLKRWVRQGGALLAVHAATVIGLSSPRLGRLFGGVFISHPEPFPFIVYPLSSEHPITAGIPAFQVHDEFYIQKVDNSVEIHMAAIYQDTAYPMVWSRLEGKGRVAVVAPGHSAEVWDHPIYQRLLLQAAGWLLNKNPSADL
jgi:type 1 glutamine amidotransferase